MADLIHPDPPDLSIDQDLALRTAAVRLSGEFTGVYGPETIERFLHTSHTQFATTGSVPHYLPLLAERFARQRPQALARVEDDPAGLAHEQVRPIRDDLERRVHRLRAELSVPAV
jgi:arsenate reductase